MLGSTFVLTSWQTITMHIRRAKRSLGALWNLFWIIFAWCYEISPSIRYRFPAMSTALYNISACPSVAATAPRFDRQRNAITNAHNEECNWEIENEHSFEWVGWVVGRPVLFIIMPSVEHATRAYINVKHLSLQRTNLSVRCKYIHISNK